MRSSDEIIKKLFNVHPGHEFNELALEIFHYQYHNNAVYKNLVDFLHIDPAGIEEIEQVPFLPISIFKTHQVITGNRKPEVVFTSSGTTGPVRSSHYIIDLSVYELSLRKGFSYFFGDIAQFCFLALLPAYLEKEDSSLVYMVQSLIRAGSHPWSGFYLNEYDRLLDTIEELESTGEKSILFGVSYALLDLAQRATQTLHHTMIMETGGMKGIRKEVIREELHQILYNAFGVDRIYSEYGMTELLSQAYSMGEGKFRTPPWMRILIRDMNDPLSLTGNNKTGGINVIDLANINSCSFIATDDLGRTFHDGSFEVLGRFDNSDIRGCNLMVE